MSETKDRSKPKDKFRIPIEVNVNDDIDKKRLKYHATKKKDDMFERLETDVELAIADYNAALEEEDKAESHWKRRAVLENDKSIKRSAKDLVLEEQDLTYWKKYFKAKQKARQKAKANVDKRTKIRDDEKLVLSGIEDKKENFVYKEGSSYTVRWTCLPSYLGEHPLNLFRDRENPVDIYVMIKNKLTDHLIKDFYLNNAITLSKRLYEAMPDEMLNTKQYILDVQKSLQSKVGDVSFTRKMGLKMTSMLLGPNHQPKFDNLFDRVEDNPAMKEPFDREARHKMLDSIKLLDGHEKLGGLGNLSKKQLDLVALYASNKIAKPFKARDNQKRAKVEKASKKPKKAKKEKKEKKSVEKANKPPKTEKGEKAKIDKINKKDLKKIIKLAEAQNEQEG